LDRVERYVWAARSFFFLFLLSFLAIVCFDTRPVLAISLACQSFSGHFDSASGGYGGVYSAQGFEAGDRIDFDFQHGNAGSYYTLEPGLLPPSTTSGSYTFTEDFSGTVTVDTENTGFFYVGWTCSSPVRTSQTINFTPPASVSFGQTLQLAATATSGLSVSFASATPSVCTVTSSGTLQTVAPGTCTILANQPGNGAYAAAAEVSQSFPIVIPGGAVSIVTGSLLPSAIAGEDYSNSITATGGASPYSFSLISGVLPSGLSFSSAGTLSGVPITPGTYNFTIRVTDSATQTADRNFQLVVGTPTISITPLTLGNGTVGASYSAASLAANGGSAPYTFAITAGQLPPGLNLSPAGTISGTPTTAGTFNFTVTATDSLNFSGAQAYTVTIIAVPPIASGSNATVAANATAPIDLSSFIIGSYTSIAIASAPAHGTATVAGTVVTYDPTPGYSGSDSFSYTATGPGGTSAPATVTITVTAPTLALTPPAGPLSNGQVDTTWPALTFTAANGTAPYSFAVRSGTFPAGMTLASSGVLSGTPDAAGSFSFSLTATDMYGATGSAAYTLTIIEAQPIADDMTATVPPNGASQIDLSSAITGVHTSIAIADDPAHGTVTILGDVVTYTPEAGYSGSDSFDYTTTGPGGTSAPATVSITVTAPVLDLTPPAGPLASGQAGTSWSALTFTAANGTAPYSFAITAGALPPGMSLSGSGLLSGTPDTVGTFNFTITATDAYDATSSATYTLTVIEAQPVAGDLAATVPPNGASQIDLASAITGVHTSIAIVSAPSHGTATIAEDVVTYDPIPGYSGADSFSYTTTGPGGTSAPATVTITVTAPALDLTPPAGALASGQVGTSWSEITLTAANGTAPYSFAISSGALPPGMTLSGGGLLSGTPDTAGAFSFSVTATDIHGASGTATYALTTIEAQPIAGDIAATVTPNGASQIDLSSVVTGVHTSIAITGDPAHGTAAAAGDIVTYNPTPGYSGSDSFSYTAIGPGGTSAPATVTITVTALTLDLTPSAGMLADGQVGVKWPPVTLTAARGTAPYTFALSSGVLPPGLALTSAGTLSGTPDTAGDFNFTIRATDIYGATGTATYSLAIAERLGSIILRQRIDGTDGIFGFTSPEPALNVSIATTNGAGQSAAIALPSGSYRVTADDMTGAGYGLTRLICSDSDSVADLASRTAMIALAPGETVICTFTAVNSAERTSELIEQFLSDRANLILANQPDLDRRIDRLNGVMSAGGNIGSTLLGYVSRLADNGALSVNTSLAAIDAMTGMEKQSRFDAWFSGTFARLDAVNNSGSFRTAAIGADYLVTPDLLVGGFVQFDYMQEAFENGAEASGTGWLVGPYLTARLADHLYLDLLAAAGRSSNTISPFGTYADDFNATRYLLSATLEGQWQWENWTFNPRARFSYLEETSDGYIDSLGVAIPSISMGKGQLSIGPGISYRFVTDGKITVDTGLRLEGVADIEEDGLEDFRGRIEGTLSLGFSAGGHVGFTAAYDGIGSDDYSTSGRLVLSIPMN